jgi:DNA-binding LytR/AlgR family response regulator
VKITIESPSLGEEDEIIIRCHNLDDKVMNLLYALKNETVPIIGYMDNKLVKLSPKDIYYFESVDNKVFAYTQNAVYEVRKKLYEIEKDFSHTDLLRISKSVIVNLAKVAYLRPIFNGRFEASLKNKEKVMISRQYVAKLKQKLGI